MIFFYFLKILIYNKYNHDSLKDSLSLRRISPLAFSNFLEKTDFSSCLSNCSNNGICEKDEKSLEFECKCFENFTGSSCQIDKRLCSTGPCLNGAQCIDSPSFTEYKCHCQLNYYGDYCENKVDLCQNVTCSNNGLCFVNDTTPFCKCFYLFYGDQCENKFQQLVIAQRVIKTSTIVAIIIFSIFFFFIIVIDLCNRI